MAFSIYLVGLIVVAIIGGFCPWALMGKRPTPAATRQGCRARAPLSLASPGPAVIRQAR